MTSPTDKSKQSRSLRGVVVRRSGNKTVAVKVTTVVADPVYEKAHKKTVRYLAHDEGNVAQVGQMVTIRQSRPLSRRKRWVVVASAVASAQGGDV